MRALAAILFKRCFESWITAMWPDRPEFIAIHGKGACRKKTNDITTIQELLDDPTEAGQLKGALVGIDAMGCQVEIADKIVAHGADYLLALKGNQPALETEVAEYLRTVPKDEVVTKTTIEKGPVSAAFRSVRVKGIGFAIAFSWQAYKGPSGVALCLPSHGFLSPLAHSLPVLLFIDLARRLHPIRRTFSSRMRNAKNGLGTTCQ